MINEIEAFDFESKEEDTLDVDEVGFCPYCGQSGPQRLGGAAFFGGTLLAIYQCYYNRCQKLFVAEYTKADRGYNFILSKTYPPEPIMVSFSADIQRMSPDFVRIYSQAAKAETDGLDCICGLGYRRSLEFLIKDYLCKKFPQDSEAILSDPLSKCIKNRLDDVRLKTLAEKSVWIGNDEAHYLRKHGDLNIDTMKRFIRAFVTFIDAEIAFQEAAQIERA